MTHFPVPSAAVADVAAAVGQDPITVADLLRVANAPGFDRWREQIRRTGGCSDPIHLQGWTITKDKATAETLYSYSTQADPGGRLRVACATAVPRAARPAPGPTRGTPTT